jgi:hypothetical protein
LFPGPPLCKTERRDRGLDSVARDNLADSLMAQGQRCLPYPYLDWARVHQIGEVGPAWGRAPACDC